MSNDEQTVESAAAVPSESVAVKPQKGETEVKIKPKSKKKVSVKAKPKLSLVKTLTKPAVKSKTKTKAKASGKTVALKRLEGQQIFIGGKKPVGPAMKALAGKIRSDVERGHCHFKSCKAKAVTPRAKWCRTHKKEIRKEQLKANNAVWHKRKKAGTVGHHVVYRNHPTEWSAKNKTKALALVKAGVTTLSSVEKAEKVLAKAPKPVRAS